MPAKLTDQEHMQRAATVVERTSPAAVRKYNRSLTVMVREMVDPAWLIKWQILILADKYPILIEDHRSPDGYRVVEGSGPTPSQEDKQRAIKFLSERGWGQAVQQIQLDAELRGQFAALNADVDLGHVGELSYLQRQQLAEVLGVRALLAPTSSGSPAPIEAESSEEEEDDED